MALGELEELEELEEWEDDTLDDVALQLAPCVGDPV